MLTCRRRLPGEHFADSFVILWDKLDKTNGVVWRSTRKRYEHHLERRKCQLHVIISFSVVYFSWLPCISSRICYRGLSFRICRIPPSHFVQVYRTLYFVSSLVSVLVIRDFAQNAYRQYAWKISVQYTLVTFSDWISQMTAHGFITLSLFPLNGGLQIEETFNWVRSEIVS